ncbi:MAG: hypothetical protein IPK64_17230 [bacterium]|nr:hypothetical protein [bacterium]
MPPTRRFRLIPGAVTVLGLLLALGVPAARAHGVRTEVLAGPTSVVTVTHDDGSPLADTPFTVLAPEGAGPFLTGRTDAHGRVAFQPDRPGAWKVRVAGADGHGAVVTVAVDSAALAAPATGATVATHHAHEHDHAHDEAHVHADAHAHDHAHDHDHAHTRDRWSGAIAGLLLLLLVLGVGGVLLRRRRG